MIRFFHELGYMLYERRRARAYEKFMRPLVRKPRPHARWAVGWEKRT